MEAAALHRMSVLVYQSGLEMFVKKVCKSNIQVHYMHLFLYDIMYSIAVCFPECQNNGTCVRPGHCVCPSSWEGRYCQEGLSLAIS